MHREILGKVKAEGVEQVTLSRRLPTRRLVLDTRHGARDFALLCKNSRLKDRLFRMSHQECCAG